MNHQARRGNARPFARVGMVLTVLGCAFVWGCAKDEPTPASATATPTPTAKPVATSPAPTTTPAVAPTVAPTMAPTNPTTPAATAAPTPPPPPPTAPSATPGASTSGTSAGKTSAGTSQAHLDQPGVEALSAQAGLPAPPQLADMPEGLARILQARIKMAAERGTAQAIGNLGRFYHAVTTSREESDRAIACYEKAKALDPNAYEWPYYLARMFFLRNSLVRARSEFELSAKLNPTYARSYAWLGGLEIQAEAGEAAKNHYMKYIELKPEDAYGYIGVGEAEIMLGNGPAAYENLQKALERDPQMGRVHQVLSKYYTQQGDHAAAEREFGMARALPAMTGLLNRDPLELELWRALGDTYLALNKVNAYITGQDPESAELLAKALLEDNPNSPIILGGLGKYYYMKGDLDRAMNLAQRALENQPDYAPAAVILANCFATQGQLEKALTEAERAVSLDPNLISGHMAKGQALRLLGRNDEALATYQAALATHPDNPFFASAIGEMLLGLGQVEEAEGFYRKALEASETFDDDTLEQAFRNFADVLVRQGKGDEAITYCRRLMSARAETPRFYILLGDILARAGQPDEAIKHMQTLIQRIPAHPGARYQLATILHKQNRLAEAKTELLQVVRADPTAESAYLLLANMMENGNEIAELKTLLRQGIESTRDSAALHNALAWTLATTADASQREPEEAVKLAERACQLTARTVATYLDTLACAYAAVGRFDDAITQGNAAIERASIMGDNASVTEYQVRLQQFMSRQPYVSGK